MPIYRGANEVDAVYRGGVEVAAVYRGASLVWEQPATGPTPQVEITPTTYTGPTLTGSLPAASGGYRTMVAGDPAIAQASVSASQTLYMVFAVRSSFGSGIITLFGFNAGGYGSWPGLWAQASGWIGDWQVLLEDGGVGTTVSSGVGMSGGWQIVEVWADGPDVSIAVDGATAATDTSSGDGVWAVTDLHIARDEGSGESFDLAAFRSFDSIPADRAAQRAWAAGFIP